MKETDFFRNNVPCEEYAENIIMPIGYNESFSHTALNNMGYINKNYDKKSVMKKNFFKYFNLKYGLNNVRTLCLLPWKNFSLIYDPHLPVSMKKSYFQKLWDDSYNMMDSVSSNRFRSNTDINQYLIRYMQLLDGNFIPRKHGIGKMYNLSNETDKICKALNSKKYKMICINDSNECINFEKKVKKIECVLERKLPEKSKFEK